MFSRLDGKRLNCRIKYWSRKIRNLQYLFLASFKDASFKWNMHRLHSLSSNARQILLISKSHDWLASNEIDRWYLTLLFDATTQSPNFKMVLSVARTYTWYLFQEYGIILWVIKSNIPVADNDRFDNARPYLIT